ncbi:MAG: oligoendopeptidase F [Bacilli bacterium]|nr:oligoendopeptidase F [Bacilli bacterium]
MENKYVWDLSYFYESEEDFLKELEEFKALPPKLGELKGKLSEEESLRKAFAIQKEIEVKLSKLYFFASMRSDRNKKDVANASDLMKVRSLFVPLSENSAYFEPEILSLGEKKMEEFFANNPELGEFKFGVEKLFRGQKHVLTPDKELLLSAYSPISSEASQLYSALTVADGSAKEATLEDGSKVTVTQANWTSLVADAKCEEDRRHIFEALYSQYEAHKNTYAEIYRLGLENQIATMKTRGYKDILDTHLFQNAIDQEVFLNLIEVASSEEGSAPLKRYLEIKRKYLGLEKFRSYDRFVQLAKSDKKYTFEEAQQTFFDSIKHFPADYQDKAREVNKPGFIDVYPGDGKRTGAYSNGGAGFHPYILLNYNGELDDVFTLAHESGHSIHTLYSEESQPIMTQDYTIFVAEIASTFNEHNLLDYFLNSGTLDKKDQIFLLQKSIDEIVSTFYRQTLFGHYEYLVSKMAEKQEPINYEVLNGVMVDLYKAYYGIDIAEEVYKPLVWAYIPHLFNSPFYVYQYATSFTSSMLIYQNVKEGKPGAFDRHIALLRSGGSDYPVEQVKKAGVDLTSKEPYLAVVRRMNELVDRLEKLLGE